MLKPIHPVKCLPALAACQQLMQRFALWLCDASVQGADVTQANLQAQMGAVIEGDWLWWLLARIHNKNPLLNSAQATADLSPGEKQGLMQWIQAVSQVDQHFGATPHTVLPATPPNGWRTRSGSWPVFCAVMNAFYEEGFKSGLPYQSDGTPTADNALRVGYEQFKREFRQAHRLDPHPDAREVCVLCGGPFTQPQVDHWIAKVHIPILAVCADNLLPVCSECNQAPQKGQKPVHTNGSFSEWFHPYFRHANGEITLRYDEPSFCVRAESVSPGYAQKVKNLDALLNLGDRWTREFKAEYRRLQRELEMRAKRKRERLHAGLNENELQAHMAQYRDRLSRDEPYFEVHQRVVDAMLSPSRQQAFLQTIS